ncbi:hypothetical protein TBLA_0B02660 [Henningerozyma blattae CBS 6284]|uniref:Uncharacterized protein n=1 Tax=Henningerozyma blattae (strain ATCC 34711 / CBS 6284 / DSM 70876 / NBRC 10599 / NRRL Y-10934 / UCD 77-7) TaxID=1071380 RepID=I2GYA6_HENB6|nr:hypothetical protein TBLA_0B02660 [Tetrapisispora blattae CBS 6284]CCH59108.1 hypothetical protein TBLA_0B02660 [Tetrapisispora blattae CBS 6284]
MTSTKIISFAFSGRIRRSIKSRLYSKILLSSRYYSDSSNKGTDLKLDDFFYWVQNSYQNLPANNQTIEDKKKDDLLHKNLENDSTQAIFLKPVAAKEEKKFTIIQDKNFNHQWFSQFKRGDVRELTLITKMLEDEKLLFSIPQLFQLLKSYQYLCYYREIHQLYTLYKPYTDLLLEDLPTDNKTKYKEYLEIFLKVEYKLKHYKICEELFSEYIQFSDVKTDMISIGLESFIQNNNIQLACQFYIQALNNPDTFLMNNKTLYLFLINLLKYSDISTMNFVFNLWIEKTTNNSNKYNQDEIHCPDTLILLLMHRAFIQANDMEGLKSFLNLPIVKSLEYINSAAFETIELSRKLKKSKIVSPGYINDTLINDQISKLTEKIKNEPRWIRKRIYYELIATFIDFGDFSKAINVVDKLEYDHELRYNRLYFPLLSTYFLKTGKFNSFLKFYEGIKNSQISDQIHLTDEILNQFWVAFNREYPSLLLEMRNELQLLLNREKYMKSLPWLHSFTESLSRDPKNRDMKPFWKSKNILLDYKKYGKVKNLLQENKIESIKEYILEDFRQGTRPHFSYIYSIFKLFAKYNQPSLSELSTHALKRYNYHIPLKYKILLLQQEINSIKNSSDDFISFYQIKQSVINKIQNFYSLNKEKFNFQNYIQLANLGTHIYKTPIILQIIQDSKDKLNKDNKLHWSLYYLTTLKVNAKLFRPNQFYEILKDWNTNIQNSIITKEDIRVIKRNIHLLDKQNEKFKIETELTPELRSKIDEEVKIFKQNYTERNITGLDKMKQIITFLESWLDKEVDFYLALKEKRKGELLSDSNNDLNIQDDEITVNSLH